MKEGEITGPDFGPSSDPKYGGFGGGGGFGSGGGGSGPEPEPEDSSWAKTEPVETRLLKAVRAGDLKQIEEILKTGVISLVRLLHHTLKLNWLGADGSKGQGVPIRAPFICWRGQESRCGGPAHQTWCRCRF